MAHPNHLPMKSQLLYILKPIISSFMGACIIVSIYACKPNAGLYKQEDDLGNPSRSYGDLSIKNSENKKVANLYIQAEQGDARAQYKLGTYYEKGKEVDEVDKQRAVYWHTKAAHKEYPPAQYRLGIYYDYGEGITKEDKEEAAKWYRQAAEQGHAAAQFNLGSCYEHGEGVEKDDRKALEWYKKSAEQGDEEAQYKLGFYYYSGKGVDKADKTTAVRWYGKAAEQDHAAAQYSLALCYERGEGVEGGKDGGKAKELYQKAADNGSIISLHIIKECKGISGLYGITTRLTSASYSSSQANIDPAARTDSMQSEQPTQSSAHRNKEYRKKRKHMDDTNDSQSKISSQTYAGLYPTFVSDTAKKLRYSPEEEVYKEKEAVPAKNPHPVNEDKYITGSKPSKKSKRKIQKKDKEKEKKDGNEQQQYLDIGYIDDIPNSQTETFSQPPLTPACKVDEGVDETENELKKKLKEKCNQLKEFKKLKNELSESKSNLKRHKNKIIKAWKEEKEEIELFKENILTNEEDIKKIKECIAKLQNKLAGFYHSRTYSYKLKIYSLSKAIKYYKEAAANGCKEAGKQLEELRKNHFDLITLDAEAIGWRRTAYLISTERTAEDDSPNTYPYKLSQITFMNLKKNEVPEKIVIHKPSEESNNIYTPIYATGKNVPYDEGVLYIDPAGAGEHETAYCIAKRYRSNYFILASGGYGGGYITDPKDRIPGTQFFEKIADLIMKHKIYKVFIENNQSDLSNYQKEIKSAIKLKYPCLRTKYKLFDEENGRLLKPNDYLHKLTIEPFATKFVTKKVKKGTTEKGKTGKEEKIDCCLKQHLLEKPSLIINRKLLKKDFAFKTNPKKEMPFTLFHQLTYFNLQGKKLRYDDRLDVMVMALNGLNQAIKSS
ncbi:MAG: hypothetical protein ACYC2U_08030 [Candidatus Amoebophilus sp.]